MSEFDINEMKTDGDETTANDHEPMTMSLMAGVARPDDLPEASDLDLESMKGPSKLFSKSSMVIVLVFLIAAGTLYAMRLSQSDSSDGAISDVEAKIDTALAKLSQIAAMRSDDPIHPQNIDKLFESTEKVIELFNNDPTRLQVSIDNVQKNPFVLGSEPTTTVPGNVPGTASDKRVDKRLAQLQKEVAELQLQSVSGGRRPAAIISGEIMASGFKIGSFTVGKISVEHKAVQLVAEGHVFILTMDTGEPSGSTGNVRVFRR